MLLKKRQQDKAKFQNVYKGIPLIYTYHRIGDVTYEKNETRGKKGIDNNYD